MSLLIPPASMPLLPARQAAGDRAEDERVGRHHHEDHHERPHEDHLRREDLAAVVHDVADPRGHAEDLRDDRHLERQPEADLHPRDEERERRGDYDRPELLPAREAIDVAHLEEPPVHVRHALDEVGGDDGERDHEGREDRPPVRETEPDDRDHDPDEDRRGVQDGEGVVDHPPSQARDERGESHDDRRRHGAAEAHEDAGERGAGVPPDLARADDLREAEDHREGRREDVGAVAPGEERPDGDDQRRRADRGQVQSRAPLALVHGRVRTRACPRTLPRGEASEGCRASLRGYARWKNSRRIRSGVSQMSELRKPNSFLILSWAMSVSTSFLANNVTMSGGAVAVTICVSFWRSSPYPFSVSALISKNVDVPTTAAIFRPLRSSTRVRPASFRATMAPSTAVATPV